MFGFFERRVDPFPEEAPEQPPKGIYQFCRYSLRARALVNCNGNTDSTCCIAKPHYLGS